MKPVSQAQLLRGIVLLHVIEAGVTANHLAGPVLRLVHDFAVIGSVELGHGHKGSPQGMGRIIRTQVTLHQNIYRLVGKPIGGNPATFAHSSRLFAWARVGCSFGVKRNVHTK